MPRRLLFSKACDETLSDSKHWFDKFSQCLLDLVLEQMESMNGKK